MCRYRVDAGDRIIAVSGDWAGFARANEGRAVCADAVLETSLWRHITGLENRLVYRQIMDYVRDRGRSVRFLFRCDSPETRRLVGMRVAPALDGGCCFETAILLEHRRPHLPLLDVQAPKSTDVLALCNWCMRADCGPLGWRALDDPCVRRTARDPAAPPRPVFTICPDCLAALRHALR
ncbi:MAG TPA: hypothetical protein PKE12_04040 [Kiritimatiellia bacterium]|nr:hypothetical protein [Kiritimatiellia bacterium]